MPLIVTDTSNNCNSSVCTCTGVVYWHVHLCVSLYVHLYVYLCRALTDGSDELVEAAEGKQRFWELPQEKFQSSGDDVNLLPLSIIQVQLLLCREEDTTRGQEVRRSRAQEDTHGKLSVVRKYSSVVICRQTVRQTHRQSDRQSDRHIDRQVVTMISLVT